MISLRRGIGICGLIFILASRLAGQQDPMFTKFLFNSLIFNPAYAGSREHLSLSFIHRKQWSGIDGAPSTQSFSGHTPLKNERIGVGLTAVNDQIGAGRVFDLSTAYTYRVKFGEDWVFSSGLQAGVTQWSKDWSKLTLEHTDDPAFRENLSRWLPNFGAGLFVYNPRFYAGIGCPRILEYDLRETNTSNTSGIAARTVRHYYFSTGGAIPWRGSEQFLIRPALLIKSTGLLSASRSNPVDAPTEADIDLSVIFLQQLWIGTAFRTALERKQSSDDSFDFWVAFLFRNGLRLGASYDVVINPLRNSAGNTYELMLGYDFEAKTSRVQSPRYF